MKAELLPYNSYKSVTGEAQERILAMQQPEQKYFFGMTYLQVGILVGLAVLACVIIGCLTIVIGRNRLSEGSLPPHVVNDHRQNSQGTNFSYFIVVDKTLTKDDAMKLITYYENKSKGYKIINVWIFCDSVYANQQAIDDLSLSDEEFFRHVLYWYMAGELTNVGESLESYPSQDYPTIGSACR